MLNSIIHPIEFVLQKIKEKIDENFVNAHVEAAVQCIPSKQRAKPRAPWETLAVRKKVCRRENRFQMQ